MKLEFNSDAIYDGKVLYKKGSIHEIEDEAFAWKWVRRGVAVPYAGSEQVEEKQSLENEVKPKDNKPKKTKSKKAEVYENL